MKKKKKGLEILIIILLAVLILIVVDIGRNLRAMNTKIDNLEIKEVVMLIPSDASCGDFWTAQELEVIAEKYELIRK
jgi:hypothetical protein